MRSSEQWWQEVKASPEKLVAWLRKQYHGEITAAHRILAQADKVPTVPQFHVLRKIAGQELQHAGWVRQLLEARGIEARELTTEEKPERYWTEVLNGVVSLESGAAVAAHAEEMRLERIRVIANDETAPADIRKVFMRILPDEEFHEKAFKHMAGTAELYAAQKAANRGRAALGLINEAEVM